MSQSDEPEPVDAEFEPAPIEDVHPDKRGGGFLGGLMVFLFAALAGGALGLGGAWWLDGQQNIAVTSDSPSDEIVAFDTRLSALEVAQDQLPTSVDLTALRDRIERLEGAPPVVIGDGGPDAVSALEARITALESIPPTGTTETDLGPVTSRLDAVEIVASRAETLANQALDTASLPAASGADPAILQSLSDRLALLEEVAAQPQPQPVPAPDLSALEARIAAAETNAQSALQQASSANAGNSASGSADSARILAARTLAFMALRDVAETSSPFEAERAALARIWRDRRELTLIQPLARSGVPDRSALTADFPRAAIEDAAGPSERLFGMIEIRRVDATDGEDGPRTLAGFATARLERGDLEGAVAAAERLEGAPLDAAQAWLISAQARLQIDTALSSLRAALVDEAVEQGADPR